VRLAQSGVPPGRFQRLRDHHGVFFGGQVGLNSVQIYSPFVAGSSSTANAFAAEGLAPVAAVRAELGPRSILTEDGVVELAERLRAPPQCVRHQIENHRLAVIAPDAGAWS
jgi:hypothetical protein